MIEVNNFDKIENLLDFDGSSIYLVWLVMRNKDGNTNAKGNNKNRTVKSYFFQTKEHFDSRKEELMKICKLFNCRAYICLNKKPLLNVLFQLQTNITELFKQMFRKESVGLNGLIDSSIMKSASTKNKLWLVDADNKDEEYLREVEGVINMCRSSYSPVVVDTIPTAHGVHIITHPFDLNQYETTMKCIKIASQDFQIPEVKKDCLTLLYASLNIEE